MKKKLGIKLINIALAFALILFGFSPLFSKVFAADTLNCSQYGMVSNPATGVCLPAQSSSPTPNAPTTLSGLIVYIITFLLGISTLVAVIMVIYGGFLYMTAGDSKRNETAKKAIKNALIGLVIIILSYTIVSLVNNTVLNCVSNITVGC